MDKKIPVTVMKFGGAALADYRNMQQTTDIILSYAKNVHPIIVVSAVKGITDTLYTIIDSIKQANMTRALRTVDAINKQHADIISNIENAIARFETEQQIQSLVDLLKLYLKKNAKYTLTVPQIDYIVSFGERFCIHLVSRILQQKTKNVTAIDTSYVLKTTNSFGHAKVLAKKNKETIKKILRDCISYNVIPFITGFIGHAEDGCITTLGRGGSDYSASSIASIMNVDEVILWKDVLGLYDNDPKKSEKAKLIKKITYDQAITMSKNGAKILHPESILPVKRKNIPLSIKCFLQPDATGTLIWHG